MAWSSGLIATCQQLTLCLFSGITSFAGASAGQDDDCPLLEATFVLAILVSGLRMRSWDDKSHCGPVSLTRRGEEKPAQRSPC